MQHHLHGICKQYNLEMPIEFAYQGLSGECPQRGWQLLEHRHSDVSLMACLCARNFGGRIAKTLFGPWGPTVIAVRISS